MTSLLREPIAVVGIGCRFPGGITSTKQFWEALQREADLVTEVPDDRFDFSSYYSRDPSTYGAVRNNRGGFVKDIRDFDADFFGFFPAEASRLDPQQRIALEASVHAVEDSGTPLERVSGTRTSVFMGVFSYDHLSIQTTLEQRDNISTHVAMGSLPFGIANRVSYLLNLQGPSLVLDTACSGSLAAVHLACQSLWAGESEAALAGGVNVILRPESTILMSKGGFLSPDGNCRPFDAAANGYVRSEGVGIVFLKPLSKALRDGDRIYSCIRGSLVNQDGYTAAGYPVPSLTAQVKLLKAVYAQANIDPTEVQYVEAHGPGTSVGDPIEANALGQHFGQNRLAETPPLWIGSVKGNFGHLEAAAGIIGFIKAALVAFHGEIPPQAKHENPNPGIDFEQLRLSVARQSLSLALHPHRGRFVGVNSFGAGGTNAHVILEGPPGEVVRRLPSGSDRGPRVFVLSARSPAALEATAKNLAAQLRAQEPTIEDVAYTLNTRRSRHSHIVVIPAKEVDELLNQLDHISSGQPGKTVTLQRRSDMPPQVAFIFSGQGGQWLRMGMELMTHETTFCGALMDFDDIFTPLAGFSIRGEISGGDGHDTLNRSTIAQPAITAIQIAVARTLIAYGIRPHAIAGHSVGEIAAAHIAGALSLEDAVSVAYLRSQIQSQVTGAGAMLAVGLSATEVTKLIQRLQLTQNVEIAAFNGPETITLTGEVPALEQIASKLAKDEVFARFIKVDTPYHSRFMDSIKDELVNALSHIQAQPTKYKLYSTVTASIELGSHLTGEYWFENVRKPVRYTETVERMLQDGAELLLEVGPHPVLLSGTRGVAEAAKRAVQLLPTMKRGSDVEPLACAIGAAHATGIDVDISGFNGGAGSFVDLPLYPFQRQSYWFEHPEAERNRLAHSRHPFMRTSTKLTDEERGILRLRLSTGVTPYLADHVVDGAIVFPMTGHLEAAYLAAKEYMGHTNVWLENCQFEHPLLLSPAEDIEPQALFEITSPANDFVVSYRPGNSAPTAAWQICSRGRINAYDQPANTDIESLDAVRSRVETGDAVNVGEMYRKLDESGIRYGDAFRGIHAMWRLGSEVFASAKLPEGMDQESAHYLFHPALSDACLQGIFAYLHHYGDPNIVYMPYQMGQVKIYGAQGLTEAYAHVSIDHQDDVFMHGAVTIYGPEGQVLATFRNLTMKRLLGKSLPSTSEYRVSFELEDEETALKKVPADVENVFILQLQDGSRDWVSSVVERALPTSQTRGLAMNPGTGKWETPELEFGLDSSALLIVPALLSGTSGEFSREELDAVVRAFIHIASWINEDQGCPTVIILTNGGFMTPADTTCDPFANCIEAAARVLENEIPQSRFLVVDLPIAPTTADMALLEEELRTVRVGGRETTVAIRQGTRFFRRIIPATTSNGEHDHEKLLPARGGKYLAERDDNNTLDGVVLREQPFSPLGPTDVGIQVHATGLSFKDVMTAMGLLNERATSGGLGGNSQTLGLEVAGIVGGVGDDVQGIKPGDRVMARVSRGLAGFVVARQDLVVRIPASLTFSEAACIPGVFLTAYYSLVYQGRLLRGETVLIHAAAGGVGIAAIQIAKHLGARVYATAGSPERREWVAQQGVEGVFDSRSTSFHDEVKKETGGRGVDVVLNSLTGPMLSQSIACLAPFGRFLEIGKTDIYRNMRVGLEQFGENCSFFIIDLDRLATQKPDTHHQVLTEICELFEQGHFTALPVSPYAVTEIAAGLNALSRSSVIGKVAIEMPESEVSVQPQTRLKLRSDRTYLITGGASGLGLHLAKFLAERGAKHLLLVNRSGPKTAEDRANLVILQRLGSQVRIEAVDVGTFEAVQSLFRQPAEWPPIAGVLHCAGVLDDVYTSQSTTERFWKTFTPKAIGAWNLHRAAQNTKLDFFMMVSSASSVLGLAGKFSYSIANQFLDALAHHRKAAGLPALAVNFGVLREFAGMSRHPVNDNRVFQIQEDQGLFSMSLPNIVSIIERSMLGGVTQTMAPNIDWTIFFKAFPHLLANGAFAGLNNEQQGSGSDVNRTLVQLSGPERTQAICDILAAGLAKILGVEPDRISNNESLNNYAFDSLTLTQLRSVILRELRVSYPLMKMFTGPSLEEIAVELGDSLDSDNA